MTLVIEVPTTHQQIEEVRLLMRSFKQWHKESNSSENKLIDQYFDPVKFGNEISSLPGELVPPHGQLLYATWDNEPAGCVAVRGLDENICEMKKMFVHTKFHGKGLGRALAEEIFQVARAMKYQYMRLDTSVGQSQAIGLYKRLGFKVIDPYYELPEELRNWLVFMELEL